MSDDYNLDMDFGRWLQSAREKSSLSIEDAASRARLTPERLRALELGYSERGITKFEATRLSHLYQIEWATFLAEAIK